MSSSALDWAKIGIAEGGNVVKGGRCQCDVVHRRPLNVLKCAESHSVREAPAMLPAAQLRTTGRPERAGNLMRGLGPSPRLRMIGTQESRSRTQADDRAGGCGVLLSRSPTCRR